MLQVFPNYETKDELLANVENVTVFNPDHINTEEYVGDGELRVYGPWFKNTWSALVTKVNGTAIRIE